MKDPGPAGPAPEETYILMVRPHHRVVPLRRIMVALAGSAFSREAVGHAIRLARATGARITLVEVVVRTAGIGALLRPGDPSVESASHFLETVRDEVPDDLGPVDVRVVENRTAAAGLIQEIRRGDMDLVVMATHGRGGMRRLIMGSIAESVLERADLPVLLCRPAGVGSGDPVARGALEASTA